ncbi:MAG: winged helix-turn-helix transcriptional regulator [Spirochaetales bacterium]|nr:winged helix-turn-helix transcriptional regulator [Spirochaetales bacterium]
MESLNIDSMKMIKALCDDNRLKILEQLKSGEKCACTLNGSLPIKQSTLSHHMKILVESNLVNVRKDQVWAYYSLSENGTTYIKDYLTNLLTKNKNAIDSCSC